MAFRKTFEMALRFEQTMNRPEENSMGSVCDK